MRPDEAYPSAGATIVFALYVLAVINTPLRIHVSEPKLPNNYNLRRERKYGRKEREREKSRLRREMSIHNVCDSKLCFKYT